MTGALRYEWARITSIASSYWMSALAVVLSAAITVIMALAVNASEIDDMGIPEVTTWIWTSGASSVITPVLAAAFYAVMGAMALGHEYRYGTNKATLTALPDRIAVLTAKLTILALWVTATVAATLLLNLFFTWLFMNGPEFSGQATRPVLLYLVYCLGFAFAGFGLAAIFRNLTGAIVAVLVWPFVLEPIVYGVVTGIGRGTDAGIGKIGNILPASAGRRMMFDPYELTAGFGIENITWGIGASALVFAIGVVGLVVAGGALFIKRDA